MTYLPHHFPFIIWNNFERYEVLTAVLPTVQVWFKFSGIRGDVKLFIHTYVSGAEGFSEPSVSHKTVTFTQELICLAIHYSCPPSHQYIFDFNLPISLPILCCRDKCNPTFPWFPYLGWRKKLLFVGINRYLYKQGSLTYQYRPSYRAYCSSYNGLPNLLYLTDFYHMWILPTSPELCTCAYVGHSSVFADSVGKCDTRQRNQQCCCFNIDCTVLEAFLLHLEWTTPQDCTHIMVSSWLLDVHSPPVKIVELLAKA
jgi:hypothetical protein